MIDFESHPTLLEPYCFVCQILSDQCHGGTEEHLTPVTGPGGAPRRIPAKSVVWVPQMAGTTLCPGLEEGGASETFPVSRLLVCTGCNICVHAACYKVDLPRRDEASGGDGWRCDRCVHIADPDNGFVTCCFCRKAGGALKRTNDNKVRTLPYRDSYNLLVFKLLKITTVLDKGFKLQNYRFLILRYMDYGTVGTGYRYYRYVPVSSFMFPE